MKILQLNINHCEAAQDLLMQTVRELEVDVAIISEPYRTLTTQPWITDTGNKAVIWSCSKRPFQSAVVGSEGFVRVKLENVHFYSCYAPPSLTFDEFTGFLTRLVQDAKEHFPVAIAGDFNAWAIDWGSRETNRRGQALLEAMSSLDVVLLNTGNQPTFVKGDATSIIDLTFVSSSLARGSTWEVSGIYTHSDHRAIIWELLNNREGATRKGQRTNAVGWKANLFDSALFIAALKTQPLDGSSAEGKAEEIMRRVAEACDATMPRKHSSNRLPPVHWWSDSIAVLRTEANHARRLSQRAKGKPNSDQLELEHKAARLKLKKAIKRSKSRCWNELIDEVDGDPWGRPYKVVMTRLKSQPMPAPTDPDLLRTIVSVLFPEQSAFDRQPKQDLEEEIPSITVDELYRASRRIGNTKAPGLDGVPNVALKVAISAAPEMFIDMYNACLREATFPTKWKQQRLVLLPKGKKPPDDPSSYRPLCMLDTAGKVLERIVHSRIETVAESCMTDNQYGFRRGRSTLDAIDLVVKTARDAIAGERWKGGTKEYCLVATLDIKNAFNSARWDRIMESLDVMNVPIYLQKMIVSYFTDRVLKYDTERGPEEYKVTGGVPQGSVLGPLLWNIMYDGLFKVPLPRQVKLVAFADDVAVIVVGKYLEDISHIFDVSFARVRQWMKSVGLELAEHKTEAVLITSRKKVETITLQVGDHEITSQPFIRYLGVMIDTRLNFKQQVEHVSAKASTVRTLLSRLMPNMGGPKQKRRALLTSVIVSVLTYGIAIWADTLALQESRRRICPIYRLSALRVASAFRTVSDDAVCVIASMLPIGVLAEERRALYRQTTSTSLSAGELRVDERRKSLHRWQFLWDASTSGRWTYRLIPQIVDWVNRKHGEVNYYLTQMLSGHGCFRAYLHRFKHEDSPECPACSEQAEDAEHVFFVCPRFHTSRTVLEAAVKGNVTPDNLVELMLSSEAAWEATSTFATEVLVYLRREERARRMDHTADNATSIPQVT